MSHTSKTTQMLGFLMGGALLFIMGGGAGYVAFRMTHSVEAPAAEQATADAGFYSCGMHPNVIEKEPGLCPICKMDLTPISRGQGAGVSEDEDRTIKYWVAPMDDSYISDRPGKSPMGMDLTPVYETDVEAGRAVIIDPTVVQNIGVRTAVVQRGPLFREIHATGEIVEDERRLGIVNLKVAGWIEKVFVGETGMRVKRGDPLFEIYSPQLVTTQEEYLIAIRNLDRLREGASVENVAAAERTLESTRKRLQYWDITDSQIARLEESREVSKTMVLRSPFGGVVTMKSALPGMKVVPGTDLYHISDLDLIWVEASVFDADLPFIGLGEPATMTLAYLPGREFTGRITFISPTVDRQTRSIKMRLEFPNEEGLLKPGMYADVSVHSELESDAVLVPTESIIHSGKRTVVFLVRGEGRFVPADVLIGPYGEGGVTQIVAGVMSGEVVVSSAQFLLDSESSFQEALRKMMEDVTGTVVPDNNTYKPLVDASFEGVPVANAVSIERDGSITIMCPVMKGTRTIETGDVFSEHEGMRVYYCCSGCQEKFEANPNQFLTELETAMAENR